MAPPLEDQAVDDKVARSEPADETKLSASERRRQRRAEQAAAKKEAKSQQQQQQQQLEQREKENAAQEEIVDPRLYFENRCAAVQDMRAKGINPYPHKFQVTMSIPEFIEKFSKLKEGEHLEDEEVCLAATLVRVAFPLTFALLSRCTGRLTRVSASGQKLRFYDVRGGGERLQVMANASFSVHPLDEFLSFHNRLRRGDIVGIRGFPGKSKRGELSVFPKDMLLLTPCLHMLPERNSLKDCDTRFRHRFLDLMVNDDTRRTFIIRSRIVSYMRSFFEARGFLEVETPMMSAVAGGAAARPFVTHHNDLDADLYLRVAPELYLKMLVVGGLEKVFELGKNFRNEGIDMTHNPEFTACEFYWAYADHNDLMDLTEELLSCTSQADACKITKEVDTEMCRCWCARDNDCGRLRVDVHLRTCV
ncbi:UNVERIFIED_CONTAM: hypothetical protein H355_003579 [Colinus virginianus]|nr:hypothetical protein H355_003579 [Colinus virginianus]